MRMPLVAVAALAAVAASAGCPPSNTTTTPTNTRGQSFSGSKVRSFTDTYPVTSIIDTAKALWIGSTRGLIKWDLTTGKHHIYGTKEGLPAERIFAVAVDGLGQVWAATPKAMARGGKGWWEALPKAPVGDFVTGLLPTEDGRFAWTCGPEGLAFLRNGKWERYLGDLGITALIHGESNVLWIGTSGKGVLRVAPAGDHLDSYGAQQGLEIDNVRGLARFDRHLIVVGDSPGGPRLAIYEPSVDRFFSYTVELDKKAATPAWAARGAAQTLIGVNNRVYQLRVVTGDTPDDASQRLTLRARPSGAALPPRSVPFAVDMQAAVLDGAPAKPAGAKVPLAPPRIEAIDAGFQLPDGVTTVSSSERGLLVGTRFLGAERIENGVQRRFRTNDLVAQAERLTVACQGDDCYLATGAARAWRFDGQAFNVAAVDPEPGSRVLAMLLDQKSAVLAIHRGASDHQLRVSTVAGKNWTPIMGQAVQVPLGAPDLNFAVFAPDGKLWVGLRYVDKDKDNVDFGAAEIGLDSGDVTYHRQTDLKKGAIALPNDTVAMFWRGPKEAWFATRSGAARLLDGKITVFTENDGMESELIRDIGPGAGNEVWVTTGRGTGKYDGTRWLFPKMGPYYLKATSLGHDGKHVFLGTEKGLYCVGECEPEPIDLRRGLVDNGVLDLAVDARGRVWALTAKGISIVEP